MALLWLGQSSTGPSCGTFSSPSTRSGCSREKIGRRIDQMNS